MNLVYKAFPRGSSDGGGPPESFGIIVDKGGCLVLVELALWASATCPHGLQQSIPTTAPLGFGNFHKAGWSNYAAKARQASA